MRHQIDQFDGSAIDIFAVSRISAMLLIGCRRCLNLQARMLRAVIMQYYALSTMANVHDWISKPVFFYFSFLALGKTHNQLTHNHATSSGEIELIV